MFKVPLHVPLLKVARLFRPLMTSLFLGLKPERASLTLTLWSMGKPIQFQPLLMVMGWLEGLVTSPSIVALQAVLVPILYISSLLMEVNSPLQTTLPLRSPDLT